MRLLHTRTCVKFYACFSAEFGFGPAVTSSIVQSCLNNKQLLDSLTRGGRKLLNTLHSELNSADQGATVKQSKRYMLHIKFQLVFLI